MHNSQAIQEKPAIANDDDEVFEPRKATLMYIKASTHNKVRLWAKRQGKFIGKVVEDAIDDYCK